MYLSRYASSFGSGTKARSRTAEDKSKPRYRGVRSPFVAPESPYKRLCEAFAAYRRPRAGTSESQLCHREKRGVNLVKKQNKRRAAEP